MKDSFILYTEQKETINKLSDEQAGKLIKAIYEYEATGIMPKLEKEIDLVITPIKVALDKNDEKWKEAKRKRSEAGKKGMASRWNNQENNITNDNKNNNVINDITKITSITDNVNVNVNDIKENNIKEKVTKRFIPPSQDDVDKYIQDKGLNVDGQQFYEYFTEGGWVDAKGNKVKNWKQKLLTWNKYVITKKEEQKKKYQSYEQRTYDKNDLSRFYANNNN